jgi:hypothetical protein
MPASPVDGGASCDVQAATTANAPTMVDLSRDDIDFSRP